MCVCVCVCVCVCACVVTSASKMYCLVLQASNEHVVATLKRRHGDEARELSSQLEHEIESLSAKLKSQKGMVEALQVVNHIN